ncbi:MAG: hypothetical protein RTU92_13990 [Candidatus Thorarchaeota archaeon]
MQFDWIFVLLGSIGAMLVVLVLVYFVIAGLLLGVALGFVGGKNRNLGSTFITALLIAVVSPIPCLNCILGLYFIKSRHNIGWGGAAIAWVLTFIIAIIVVVLVMMVAFAGIWAAIIASIPFFP